MAFLSEPIPMIAHICTMVNIILRWAITNSISIQQFTRRYFFLWGQIFLFLKKQMSTGKTFFSYFLGQLDINKETFFLFLRTIRRRKVNFFWEELNMQARRHFPSSLRTIRHRQVNFFLLIFRTIRYENKEAFFVFFWGNQTNTRRDCSSSFWTIRHIQKIRHMQTRRHFSSSFVTMRH